MAPIPVAQADSSHSTCVGKSGGMAACFVTTRFQQLLVPRTPTVLWQSVIYPPLRSGRFARTFAAFSMRAQAFRCRFWANLTWAVHVHLAPTPSHVRSPAISGHDAVISAR